MIEAGEDRTALRCMLEARSVALVGASPRAGSFAERARLELERSPSVPVIHLVNPRYRGETIGGHEVVATLDDIEGPVDLVLFAVGDSRLESELARAARRGDRSGVIYGSAVDPHSPEDSQTFRARLAEIARSGGMALCGGGCMGFISGSLRAIGYLEPWPLPSGPIALVSHSGSAFSALLRTDRPFSFSLAVSSGQELVTPAADYLEYALTLPETGLVVLLLETLRAPAALRRALTAAAEKDVPVVALTVGSSEAGRAMVAAHSGALAGTDGAWEALFRAYGVARVEDMSELCDTVELLLGRRAPARPGRRGPGGVGAVLDSGGERALLVDLASRLGVAFAPLEPESEKRLIDLLDPGLPAVNPVDVWGTGSSTKDLVAAALAVLCEDDGVDAVVLAVDLVREEDGDDSYASALEETFSRTELPLCLLTHTPASLDRAGAARLRASGIPVLEGTRSGLVALRHLLARRRPGGARLHRARADESRRRRWSGRLVEVAASPGLALELLADYGIDSPRTVEVSSLAEARAAGEAIGYPVALKTAADVAHKSEAGGVLLGLSGPEALGDGYLALSERLGPRALVAEMASVGTEVSCGIVVDPLLGPLVVVAAGGVLVELVADRAVALPPLDRADAGRLVEELRLHRLLMGFRNRPPADMDALAAAVSSLSDLALELGDELRALEINPLSVTESGVLALDVLVEV